MSNPKGSFVYKDYLVVPKDNLWVVYAPNNSQVTVTITKLGAKAYINRLKKSLRKEHKDIGYGE